MSRPRPQAGFSMIEVLIAIMVLGIVAGGLAAGLIQTSTLLGRSKGDSVADKLALSQMEDVRLLDYEDVGVVNGNPPGVLVADRTATSGGAGFRVQQSVSYVDDPAPGGARTRIDYKRVQVVVTPLADGGKPVTQTTLVAPPEYASIAGRASILVTAKDGITGEAIPDAAVTVSGGPSPTTNDVTDADGGLVVPGLLPSTTQDYTTQVSKAGYVVTNPATDFTTELSAGEAFPVNAKLVKPVRVEVNLRRGTTTTPITESATVTLTSPSGASGSLTGTGVFAFTALGGQPVLPSSSQDYTLSVRTECLASYTGPLRVNPAGYPSNLVDVENVGGFTRGFINVQVLSNLSGLPVLGSTVTITGGDAGITGTAARKATDSTGRASFCVPATTTAAYTVTASAALFLTRTTTVRPLASEGTQAVTLRLLV